MRSIGRQSVVYGAGMVISKLASFLMLPIYTRYLTPSDYGVLELLAMTIDAIGMLVGMGLALGVFRFYADCSSDEERRRVLSTSASSAMLIAFVTSLLGTAFSTQLSDLVLHNREGASYFRMFFLIYLLQVSETVPLMQLRLQHRALAFVMISCGKLLAMLMLNIIFVVKLGYGIRGVLLSNLLVSSVTSIGLVAYLFRHTGLGFSQSLAVSMIRYGAPLVIVNIGNFVLVFSDRFFLNHFSTVAAVGIYALAYRFAFLVSAVFVQPFAMVWGPHRFVVAKAENGSATIGRVFLYFNLVLGLGGTVIAILSPAIVTHMADAAFFSARTYIPILVLAQIVFVWGDFVNIGFLVTKNTVSLARASFIGVAAVLLFNTLLIPRFGIAGAAVATLIAYLVRFVSILLPSQRQFFVEYPWGRIVLLYGSLTVVTIVRLAFESQRLSSTVVLDAIFLVIAAAMAYWIVLDASDRKSLRQFIVTRRLAGIG